MFWPSLSPVPHLAQYFVQSWTPTSTPYHYPYYPNRLSKGAAVGHGVRLGGLSAVPSSARPSLDPMCASDRGKWS